MRNITAWQHNKFPCRVISDEVKNLWLKVNPNYVEHYTIPLAVTTQRMPPPCGYDKEIPLIEKVSNVKVSDCASTQIDRRVE